MKFYPFPTIRNVDDIMPALEGREEIKLMDRGGYSVVDYLYVLPDTFPPIPDTPGTEEWNLAILRRECRGLMFRPDGTLLSRRLHKFFNMGERPETLPEAISFDRPHHILDKEDGSMMSPYIDPQEDVRWAFDQAHGYTQRVFWGTMMGWTDVAQNAEKFIETANVDYNGFARAMLSGGWTPIFEWCSPDSRIVLKHVQPKLVLISIRHNETGVYKTYEDMVITADAWGVPVVASLGQVGDVSAREFMERVHGETDIEGYIVLFDNGHCIKLKTSWYLRFHKAKENLVHEKDVWNLILANQVDDVMPVLMNHDRDRLEVFQTEFAEAMEMAAQVLSGKVLKLKTESGDDRGRYAEKVKNCKSLIGPMKGMAFKLYTQPLDDLVSPARALIRQLAVNSVGSASKIEEARKIISVNPW